MPALPPDHPMLLAIANAPEGEPLTPEQEAELDQIEADIAAGRANLVLHGVLHVYRARW